MAAVTVPQRRRLTPLRALPLALLLLLPLPLSGAATGSLCFGNKTCHLRKRTLSWNVEARDRLPDSEHQPEMPSSIQKGHEIHSLVHGKEESTVGVYVLVYSNKLILNCLTEKLAHHEILDPIYQWSGPLGRIIKESEKFVLTEDGRLKIYHIQGSDSGDYFCKVNYLYNGDELTAKASFIVNDKLESLIQNLGCEIKQWSTQCHVSAETQEELTHMITFQFAVFPLALTASDICRGTHCGQNSSSIRKAYAKIKFFIQSQSTDSSLRDNLGYIPGSFTGFREDHCKPGFGKNVKPINNDTVCSGCCVICPPGTFSVKYDTICTLCAAGSYNEKYSQEACKNCPGTESSNSKGAVSKGNCHRILPMWLICLISSSGTSLILLTAWIVITKCCKKSVAVQYIKEAGTGLKNKVQTLANITNDAEIREQRGKLIPIKTQSNMSNFNDDILEESMEFLSNDEPFMPADISPSPDQMGLETSYEQLPPPVGT